MKNSILAASVFLFAATLSAQSPSTPVPVPQQFSESQAYRPREFPPSKDAGKKQKKQEEAEKAKISPPPQVRKTESVSLTVSIVNIQGKSVSGLGKENLRLFLDGQEAEITSVTETSEPANFIFLIDASPSAGMNDDEVTRQAQYVLGQLTPGDRAMVVRFDAEFNTVCKLTDDLQAARKAIQKIKMGNGTALYDHIRHLSEKVIPNMTGRTAVILFTDGVDTVSKRAKYETSLAIAERLDAVFYTVYFDTLSTALATTKAPISGRQIPPFNIPLPPFMVRPMDPKQLALDYQLGINYINDLATMSGGRAARAESLSNSTGAPFVSIPAEIRNRYIVTFVPAGMETIGQRHELKVRVDRPNLVVLARGSHIVR